MHQPFFKRHYEKNSCVKYLLYAAIFLYSSHYVIANAPSLKTVNELSIKETSETDPPEYLINKLNLESMEGANSPVENIDILKQRLAEHNEDLKKREKPLIYLGLANKEEFFNTPYFLNRYKEGEASNEELAEGYSQKLGLRESRNDLGVELEDLTNMLKADYSNQSASLFSEEASSIDEKGIVITKYYYGLLKAGADPSIQSATVQWLSVRGYQLSPSLKGKLAIDETKLKTHYNSLKSLQENETLRLIEAWHNYLIDKELPKKQDADVLGIASLDTSDACRNLTKEEGDQKSAELISVIKDKKTAIAQRVLNTCYPVIESLAYEHKITAIRYLVSGIVEDYKETAILRLIHSIPSSSFGAFFADLKAEKEGHILMTDLLSNIDDVSLLFQSYGENFTSLVEEFKRMGSANAGEQFKKERIYLLESLLGISPTISILEGIHSLATYELQPDETGYGDYLVKDDYKNLLRVFNYGSLGLSNRELLITSGNALGSFLVGQKKQAIFKELPEVIFSKPGDDTYDQIGIHVIAGLYKHLPNDDEAVYEYLSVESFTKLKLLIEKVHTVKASQLDAVLKVTTTSFYDGVTNLLDNKASIDDRTDLARWVLDKDEPLEDYRNFFLHIFDNIVASDDRKKVYDFLAKGWDQATVDYHYLKKITTKGVLSGDERQISFLKYYMGLINEHGSVLDREYLLRNVLREGDDFSYLKWHDTEDLVSVLFSNMSAEDGMYLQRVLSADSYQLFKEIWVVMENSILWTAVDRDNQRFEEFVMSFSKLFTKDSYNSVYGDNQSYLNINEKPSIESIGNHIPFVRTKTINLFGEHTDYSLTSEIEKDGAGSEIISIKVELGNEVLIDKKLAPFDPVFIEFIEDTEISPGVHFKIGDVILVPAFYVAWMDGSISSQNINSTLRVGADFIGIVLNGAAIVATVASGGALSPLLLFNGAEIVFSFADASIVMFEGELKEEFGEEFINKLEIANLIWGVANLPMAVTSGVVVIKTVSGKVYESGKLAIKNIKGRILEVRIKPDELFQHLSTYSKKLSGLKSWDKTEMMEVLFSIEARMKAKVKSFSSNLSTADFEHYKIVKIALYAMYLNQVPELAQLVLTYPNKFKMEVVDRVLKLRYGNKTFCNITADGILQNINLVAISDGSLLPNQVINNFQTSIKYGEVIIEDVLQVVVKQNGEPVFRRGFKKGFTRKGRLLNEYSVASPSTQRLLYPTDADVTDIVLPQGSEIYALEQAGRRGEIIMALNKKVDLTEGELQSILLLQAPANDIDDLLLVEYETLDDLNVRESMMRRIDSNDPLYTIYGIIESPDGSIKEMSIESLSDHVVNNITPKSNFDSKKLHELISKKFKEYYDDIIDDDALLASVLNEIKISGLPESVKLEIVKIANDTELSNILVVGGEALFELASSSNPELVKYAAQLIDSRLTFKIGSDEVFIQAINNAERVYELPAVSAEEITNGSGGLGVIFAGDFNGKPAILKYDRADFNGVKEIENVVKGLEPYGGPQFYGRARVQGDNGVWREAVAIERIEGYDVLALKRLANQNKELPIEITSKHLEAIDNIIEQLSSEGNILTETNLGDFMLTNDPNRPVVLLDMFVTAGTSNAQGLLDHEGLPVRNSIEELIISIANVPSEYLDEFNAQVKTVTKLKGDIAVNLMPLYPELSYENIIAVVYFTSKEQMDNLADLNTILLTNDLNELDASNRIFIEQMASAIGKIPKNTNSNIVYSGNVPIDISYSADDYIEGEILQLKSYLVASKEKQIATNIMNSRKQEFINEGLDEYLLPVFFEIRNSAGHDLGQLSAQPELIQILFDKKDNYKLISRRIESMNGMRVHYMVLEHFGDSNLSTGNGFSNTDLGLRMESEDVLDMEIPNQSRDDAIVQGLSSISEYTPSSDFSQLPNFESFRKDPIVSTFLDEFSEKLNSNPYGIVAEEYAAIISFSINNSSYSPLTGLKNPSLPMDGPVDYFINRALDKLPVDTQNQTVFIAANGILKENTLGWEVGNNINFKGNLLANTKFEVAQREMSTVLIEVQNSKGHNVSEIITLNDQYDLLFKSNTHFVVKSIETKSVGGKFGTYIILEQTDGNTSQSSNTSNTNIIESTLIEEPLPNNVISMVDRKIYKKVEEGGFVYVLISDTKTATLKQYFTSEEALYKAIDVFLKKDPDARIYIKGFETNKNIRFLNTPTKVNTIDFETFQGMEFEEGTEYVKNKDLTNLPILDYLTESMIISIPDKFSWITNSGYVRITTDTQIYEEIKDQISPNEFESLIGYEDFLKREGLMIETAKIISEEFVILNDPRLLTAIEFVILNDFLENIETLTPFLRKNESQLANKDKVHKHVLQSAIAKLSKTDEDIASLVLGDLDATLAENAMSWREGETFIMPDFVLVSPDEEIEIGSFEEVHSSANIQLVIKNPKGGRMREIDSESDQIFLNSGEYEVIESIRVQKISGETFQRILIEQKIKI